MEVSKFEFIIGIGQILAVALIPVIIWLFGVKYQNRKTKKDVKLKLFLTVMVNRRPNEVPKELVDAFNTIDIVFQEDKKVRNAWADYFESLHTQSIKNEASSIYLLRALLLCCHEYWQLLP